MPKYELYTTAELSDFEMLRGYVGRANAVCISHVDEGGLFAYDATDTTSVDDDADTIVGNDGRRWRRVSYSMDAVDAAVASATAAAAASAEEAADSATAAALSADEAEAIVLGDFLQSGTGAQPRTFSAKVRESVSVLDFGAIGDGTLHPLSERYATLGDAQVDYPFVTALTQSIDWAAFQAAHNSLSGSASSVGGTIYVPPGSYHLSDTWEIKKRCVIQGAHAGQQASTAASLLTFPADTDGIRLHSFTSGVTSGDRTAILDLNLQASAKNSTGIGIYCRSTPRIERCVIRGFQGHGIHINAITASGYIADLWYVAQTYVTSCGGNGLHVNGDDGNVGCATNVDCSQNAGWGFYDNAAYCNTYVACHAAGNTTGAFRNRNATGFGGLYLGCYVEGGTGDTVDMDGNVIWIGGVASESSTTQGNSFRPSSVGFALNANQRFIFRRQGTEIGRITETSLITGFKGFTFTDSTDNETTCTGNRMTIESSTTAGGNRMLFMNPNGTVGSITTSGSATAFNTSSDYRLKDDVVPMTGALAKLALLNPVTYTWKSDGTPGQGFIAHELQEHFPDAVTGEKDAMEEVQVKVKDEDGNVVLDADGEPVTETKIVPKYQGVDTSFLVATLVAGLNELRAEFEAYKASHP